MLNVTNTFLPPIEEYIEYLRLAWDKNYITNRGPLVLKLENELKSYLKVKNLTLTANGTLPIQIGLKTLGLHGEIITTPFSYVATASAIVWENLKPVFVDIDPIHWTINEELIEEKITEKTTAILATHVFGNPCNVNEIERIANKYNLKVIYDSAHCFGVKYMDKSIFEYGDVSTCSFHATKLFHTGEGGCWITNNELIHNEMFYAHKFGHDGPDSFKGLGINAKMSELQAAMGLANLHHIDQIILNRKNAVKYYDSKLNSKSFEKISIRKNTDWNFQYYPILFKNEKELLLAQKRLNSHNIFPRRYFFPSLNNLDFISSYQKCPVSETVSSRIMCLPLSAEITSSDIERVINIIQ